MFPASVVSIKFNVLELRVIHIIVIYQLLLSILSFDKTFRKEESIRKEFRLFTRNLSLYQYISNA